MVELKGLSIEDGSDVYEMLQDIPSEENGFLNAVNGKTYEEYQQWLAESAASSNSTELENGWKVPTSTFWLFCGGKPVGIGRIRHFLTDRLREEGGQVGYAIRPGERNKGCGSMLLKGLVLEAQRRGMQKVLLTIRNGNEASLKVALKNGGVVEKISNMRHYVWIDCSSVNA